MPPFDPYRKVRDKVQQAINSGHFDSAVTIIESLLEQTSPRKDDREATTVTSSDYVTSAFDEFSEIPMTTSLDDTTPPSPPHQQQQQQQQHEQDDKQYNDAANLSFGPLHDTVLLESAAKDQPAALIRMLELGANPSRPNARGLTPLIKAAGAGNTECCRILLEAGVDLFSKDQKGRTALDWARIGNKQQTSIFLEKQMEDIIVAARDEEFGRVKTAELTRLVNKNKFYYDSLTKNTLANDLPAVMKLIEDVPFDRIEYTQSLKALGMPHDPPETPYFIDVETDTGATPLMLACAQAECSDVEKLLEAGAKLDTENRRGHTALSWTCVCGHHQIVAALLSSKVNSQYISRLEKKTPLIHAAYNGTNQCVSLLLDNYMQFAMDRRFNLSKKKLTKLEAWDMERNWLKPYEKMVLHKDIYDKTALEWARDSGNKETVKLLEAAHDRIAKRAKEIAREEAFASSVACRLGCGYVDRADRIEKHEVQRCPRRIVGCESCGQNIPANTIPKHDAEECPKRMVKCENRYRGCLETLPFDELHSHQTHRCMYRRDQCRLCGRSMLHHQRDEHEADLCPLRMVSCSAPVGLGCGEVLRAQDMRDHLKHHCSLRLVKCRVGCGQSFPEKDLEYHEKHICVQICMWEGCGKELGPEDVRTLHEKFLCPRRVVKCPNCPIAGLVAERLDTHLEHMCSKRRVKSLFDLDPVLADERPGYEESERGSCIERLQRCRLDYIGRRIKVRNKEKKCFETATIKHFRESDGRFKIQFPDGFKWCHLSELDFLILDNWKWTCGYISSSTMSRHLLEDCSHRAVMCRLGCGQKIFERGRVTHENEQCPKRLIKCHLGCGLTLEAEEIFEHAENLCPLREVMCGSCGQSLPLPELENHMVTDCPLAKKRCPQGCGAELQVGRFEKHTKEECPKRLVTCEKCGDDSLFADELEGHLAGTLRDQECPMRNIKCELCGNEVIARDMEDHVSNVCPKRVITCDCGMKIVAENQSDHRILECNAVTRYCSLGCGQKMRVMDMENHQKTDCPKRHLIHGKLLLCPLGCGAQVSFAEQFTHMTSICPKRIVECENHCPEVVREEELADHRLVCRLRKVSCGAKSDVCLRQVRCWLTQDMEGKRQLVCCENHQSNALMWAVQAKETKLVNYFLEQTENRGLDFETPFGDTPLTKAASMGNVEMLSLLIGRAQADGFFISDFVNYETGRGKTALSEAAKNDHDEACKFLVKHRAQIDYKTKFYRKTALDWASNLKCEKALDALKRAYKIEKDVQRMFIAIAGGNLAFVKEMVKDGELFRLDHARTLYNEIVKSKADLEKFKEEVAMLEVDIEKMRPADTVLHEHLDFSEVEVKDLEETADMLLEQGKNAAARLQGGFSNSIIAINSCGSAEMSELIALGRNAPEEVLQVIKAVCLLRNIQPKGKSKETDKVKQERRQRSTALVTSKNAKDPAVMAELFGYWDAATNMLKSRNLSHQLRYYTKTRPPPGSLEMIRDEIESGGWLDYDLKYRLFLNLEVDGREREVLDEGDDEDKKEEYQGGFDLVAALAKWVKAIVQYSTSAQMLEETKQSEILFREQFDVKLVSLKKERVEVGISAFRLSLLEQDLEDAKGRVRWAERRIDGGESHLSVAKLLGIVTASGHTILSWACACGNTEIVDYLIDHGAYPGFGDDYCHLAAKSIQFVFRHHRWRVTREPWCRELAREYRNREIAFTFGLQAMGDQMTKIREHVRMPLTEAFYNGMFQVADSFEKKKVPMYHASITKVMPAGITPILGDPAGKEELVNSLNIVECAEMGKKRFQSAVWAHGVGWQKPGSKLDRFENGIEAAQALWDHINSVVEEGRAEMLKRRGIRHERAIKKEWGAKMDQAIKKGNFPFMIECAKQGCAIDYQTETGVTPLLRAAMEDVHAVNHSWCINDENKEVSAVSYLLDRLTKRPMIDYETSIGHTALTFAAYHARMGGIEDLLDRGVQVNKKVRGGKTALIYAAMNGKADVCKLLLERGADMELVDDEGKTASDWAKERNFNEVLACLAKEIGGDKGVVKAATGEALIRVPCCWGCGEMMIKVDLLKHEQVCGYRKVECIYCDKDDLQAREKREHEENECKMRPVKCYLCNVELLSHELADHMNNVCEKRLSKCEFCGDGIRQDKMSYHVSNLCKKRLVECPNDCGVMVAYNKMAVHKRHDCDMRRVRCMMKCGQTMWAKNREEHEKMHCPERMVACEFCGEKWKAQHLLDHQTKCEEAPVTCVNANFGCNWSGPARLMPKHLKYACDHTFNHECPLLCGLKMRKVDVEKHLKVCAKRTILCKECDEEVVFAGKELHDKYECQKRRKPCGVCGEMVDCREMIRHKDHFCKMRTVVCRNSGCYKKLPLAEMEQHEMFECRRTIVYCRVGCGNTMYREKRDYHEREICDFRFVECPLCEEKVRSKDKVVHMETECIRRNKEV